MSPNLVTTLRFLWYLFSRLILASLVVGIVVLSFFVAMDYMNVQVLVKDGLNLRADVVIKGADPTPLTKVFSKNILENDILLKDLKYKPYIISSYEYDAKTDFSIILPWNDIVTMRVTEKVSKIRGELFVMAENASLGETPPEWDDAVYNITLMRYEDNWRITAIELVEFLPKPSYLPPASFAPVLQPTSNYPSDEIEGIIEE